MADRKKNNEVIENIKLQLELVALNNHLYITFSDTGGEVPSGIALKIKDYRRFFLSIIFLLQ